MGSIAARVRALAAGTVTEAPTTMTFAAAEARVRAMAHSVVSARDLSDAAMLYAADALAASVVEEGAAGIDDIDHLVATVAEVTELSIENAAFSLYMRASASPQILNLPPRVAAEAHLRLLVGLAPVTDASLWVDELGGADAAEIALQIVRVVVVDLADAGQRKRVTLVDELGGIEITGAHNDVFWHQAAAGAGPQLIDRGTSNTFHPAQ